MNFVSEWFRTGLLSGIVLSEKRFLTPLQLSQVVTIADPPPVTSKFLTGGFLGVTVDVGIVGSWLGTQFTKTIKEGFR